jgi:oligopeptide transport system substrate-binding protein
VHFNTSRGVLADARIRRALSLALDRGAAASAVSRLDVRPSTTCVPPVGNWGDDRTVEEDIAEARRLLAEAGYPEGRGFPVLHWPYRIGTNKAFSRLPELCAAQWRERLGIPVYTRLLDDDAYLARERERDYDLILATWFGAMPDAARLAQLLVDPALLALSDWQDPELEALVGKTRALRGGELHDALVVAERRFLAGMPATPVFVYNRHTLKHRSVLGWYPDPVGLHPLKHLRLADAPLP